MNRALCETLGFETQHEQRRYPFRTDNLLGVHPGVGLFAVFAAFIAAEQFAEAAAGGGGMEVHVGVFSEGEGLAQ